MKPRQPRHLADLIDDAAGRAAAEQDGGRTLQNLNLLHVEGIAVIIPDIALTIDEHVGAGDKAPDCRRGAQRFEFAGPDRDAGNIAKCVVEVRDRAVLEQLLRNRVDGLRRIDERFGEFGQTGRLDVVIHGTVTLDQNPLSLLLVVVGCGGLCLRRERMQQSQARTGQKAHAHRRAEMAAKRKVHADNPHYLGLCPQAELNKTSLPLASFEAVMFL